MSTSDSPPPRRTLREIALFAEAWASLAILTPALRLLPFAFLERFVTSRSALGERRAAQSEQVTELVRALDRAVRRFPWHVRCLPRALALRLMLDRRGFAGQLRLGVRRDAAGFAAHAWVEFDGEPLAESPASLAGFVPLEPVPR